VIRVIYRWRVDPDLGAQFASWWHQGTIGIRHDHAGALGSLLLRSRDDPNVFVGVARWETEHHLAEFRRRAVPLSFAGAELEAIELLDELDDLTEDRRVGADRPSERPSDGTARERP
jgi:heme-degrading monooxygenase HmoA